MYVYITDTERVREMYVWKDSPFKKSILLRTASPQILKPNSQWHCSFFMKQGIPLRWNSLLGQAEVARCISNIDSMEEQFMCALTLTSEMAQRKVHAAHSSFSPRQMGRAVQGSQPGFQTHLRNQNKSTLLKGPATDFVVFLSKSYKKIKFSILLLPFVSHLYLWNHPVQSGAPSAPCLLPCCPPPKVRGSRNLQLWQNDLNSLEPKWVLPSVHQPTSSSVKSSGEIPENGEYHKAYPDRPIDFYTKMVLRKLRQQNFSATRKLQKCRKVSRKSTGTAWLPASLDSPFEDCLRAGWHVPVEQRSLPKGVDGPPIYDHKECATSWFTVRLWSTLFSGNPKSKLPPCTVGMNSTPCSLSSSSSSSNWPKCSQMCSQMWPDKPRVVHTAERHRFASWRSLQLRRFCPNEAWLPLRMSKQKKIALQCL